MKNRNRPAKRPDRTRLAQCESPP